MVFLWFSHEITIFLWFSYGLPPFSYGFPMVFLSSSHHGHPRQLLWHDAQETPEGRGIQGLHVLAINQHLAVVKIGGVHLKVEIGI